MSRPLLYRKVLSVQSLARMLAGCRSQKDTGPDIVQVGNRAASSLFVQELQPLNSQHISIRAPGINSPANMSAPTKTYAVLGATGNCGSALIENLLDRPNASVHAYCRNKAKLLKRFPDLDEKSGRVRIFEGSIQDTDLLASCVSACHAVFLCVSTNDNIPGCRMARDVATAVVGVLKRQRDESIACGKPVQLPKLLLLSSNTTVEHFAKQLPQPLVWVLRQSASYVYHDLIETEKLLRAEESWLTTIYIKPGALSVDAQRGHSLSLTMSDGPLSYLDLAAGMIEAADSPRGGWDRRNVAVNPVAGGKASFPSGTPMCILLGLLRHYLPSLHHALPANTGP